MKRTASAKPPARAVAPPTLVARTPAAPPHPAAAIRAGLGNQALQRACAECEEEMDDPDRKNASGG